MNHGWRIVWDSTGEITTKEGYKYPHTAMKGAKAFVREALKDREYGETDPIRVLIFTGRWDKPVAHSAWEGTAEAFVKS